MYHFFKNIGNWLCCWHHGWVKLQICTSFVSFDFFLFFIVGLGKGFFPPSFLLLGLFSFFFLSSSSSSSLKVFFPSVFLLPLLRRVTIPNQASTNLRMLPMSPQIRKVRQREREESDMWEKENNQWEKEWEQRRGAREQRAILVILLVWEFCFGNFTLCLH